MMRKTLTFVLMFALLTSAIVPFVALATSEGISGNEYTVSMSADIGEDGIVTATVTVKDIRVPLDAIILQLTYDTSVLRLLNEANGENILDCMSAAPSDEWENMSHAKNGCLVLQACTTNLASDDTAITDETPITFELRFQALVETTTTVLDVPTECVKALDRELNYRYGTGASVEIEIYQAIVHEHTLIHMEAVEPVCHYEGNIEHWYCDECETVWADEALTQVTNHKSVILPATGEGNLVHMEAIEPNCHMDGNIEHWYCDECETVWADEALTQVTNHKSVILPATGEGTLVHMEAVAPACHYEGNIEHWVCYDCEQVWQDEALTQLTNHKNVILPATGGEVIHVEAKAPTATEDGNIEYWYCEECEKVWVDELGTQLSNIKNVVISATGVLFGDVDGNGEANANDYFKLKRNILGTFELDEEALARADISGDGEVTAKDYLMLKSYILGTWSPDAA